MCAVATISGSIPTDTSDIVSFFSGSCDQHNRKARFELTVCSSFEVVATCDRKEEKASSSNGSKAANLRYSLLATVDFVAMCYAST